MRRALASPLMSAFSCASCSSYCMQGDMQITIYIFAQIPEVRHRDISSLCLHASESLSDASVLSRQGCCGSTNLCLQALHLGLHAATLRAMPVKCCKVGRAVLVRRVAGCSSMLQLQPQSSSRASFCYGGRRRAVGCPAGLLSLFRSPGHALAGRGSDPARGERSFIA